MEVEAKYHAPSRNVLASLAGSEELGGLRLLGLQSRDVWDVFLDTEGWALLTAGYYCRRRSDGERVRITVKQLGPAEDGVHRREELEVELAEYVPPAEWPESAARAKVLELSMGEPLADMLELRQTRLTRLVGDADVPVAELSLDEVHVKRGRAADAPETVFFEVELELKEGGSEEQLSGLASELEDKWSLVPEPLSKFERALAASREVVLEQAETAAGSGAEHSEAGAEKKDKRGGKHHRRGELREPFLGDGLAVLERPGLTADDTMAAAANKTLLYHLQRMMQHEPGTREGGDPEELHDMRVATRRMRAAMRVFERYLDTEQYKPFLRAMRETGRELGAVRDLDVFRIKTQAYVDSLPVEEQAGLDPLLDAWQRERERARGELIAYLDSSRYQHFKERFEAFLRAPQAGAGRSVSETGEPLPTRVGDVLPGVVFDKLAEAKAFDRVVSQADAPLLRLHQLRITSKGLRYTLEFFQEVLGPGSKPLIDSMKRVQDHLGDLQDAVVTCDVLLGFLASGTWGHPARDRRVERPLFPVNAPGVATYLAAKQNEIERLMGTFGPVWEQVRGTEFSGPLAALVGVL